MTTADLFATYPDVPGWKRQETSREAAETMAPKAASLRTKVISTLNRHPSGITPDECAALLNLDVLAIRPRFSELNREGLIEKTGDRRANRSGLRANVWRPVASPGVVA